MKHCSTLIVEKNTSKMLFLMYYTWQYKRQVVRNGMAKPVSKYCVVYTVFTAINTVLEYMFYVIYLKHTPNPHVLILLVNATNLVNSDLLYLYFLHDVNTK